MKAYVLSKWAKSAVDVETSMVGLERLSLRHLVQTIILIQLFTGDICVPGRARKPNRPSCPATL